MYSLYFEFIQLQALYSPGSYICVCCFTICLLYIYKLVLYKQVIRLQFKYQIVQVHNVSIILLVFNSFVYILCLWYHLYIWGAGCCLFPKSINQSINQSEQSLSLKQIHTQYKVMSQQCYLKPFTHVVKWNTPLFAKWSYYL